MRRSLTLWFGLFGLISILWAWSLSIRQTCAFNWQSGHLRVAVMNRYSALRLQHIIDQRTAGIKIHDFITDLHVVNPAVAGVFDPTFGQKDILFPAPEHATLDRDGGRFFRHSFILPHWLLLAGYLAVWIPLLTWRMRKRRGAAKLLAGE